MNSASQAPSRVDWVDYAKGLCIIMVVMMHSTLGVEKAAGQIGYINSFIEWAKPFRMPDFFLISGLFLTRRINVPWRSYLDSKVIHFAYFYILWMTIQLALKSWGVYQDGGPLAVLQAYAMGFIQPFGTLWFIYLLAIFFVVVRLLCKVPPLMVFSAAAALEILPVHTGWLVIDEFASRFVYFYAGYWLAPYVFSLAEHIARRSLIPLLALLYVWASLHSYAVISGYSAAPGLGLVLGFAGAAAVITLAVLLAKSEVLRAIRYLGEHSLMVYLAFFLPMAVTRSVGLKLWPSIPVDLLSVATSIAALAGPIILFWLVRKTPLSFLFKRPAWASLKKVEKAETRWHSERHDLNSLQHPQAR
jgi:uncharacterized membrane protein YcfT